MDNLTPGTTAAPRFAIAVQSKNGPHGTDPFFEELLTGMEEALDQHGATVFLRQFSSYQDELDAYPLWAESGAVDAVVVVDSQDEDSRAGLCVKLGLPVVVLGGPAGDGVSLVDVDNSGAMEMAVDFLADLGHKTIGRVSGPAHLHHTKSRSLAFEQALAARDVTGLSAEGNYSAESGAARTRDMLSGAKRPTAIVYDNSIMAVAGLEAARRLGLKVPEEVSLLAWDDGPHCRLADPPLSVVSLDVYELGRIVAAVLMQTYSGALQTVVHVPTARIVQRGSTSGWPSAGSDSKLADPALRPRP
ncbi:LacI family DNA-binding transcriptional regulator [Pseudarthrobacter sp. B4EP4b]|uniref:LacI family DNA-binding transcriptional regulator n=1 Tax=Pseudarthrobacter sp. B4EP4b TaxID=2590664 RepID=UPI00114DECC0|nr:substrate-binding domain-containing protein [Pseudarthrobacter sp. B4EP4b]